MRHYEAAFFPFVFLSLASDILLRHNLSLELFQPDFPCSSMYPSGSSSMPPPPAFGNNPHALGPPSSSSSHRRGAGAMLPPGSHGFPGGGGAAAAMQSRVRQQERMEAAQQRREQREQKERSQREEKEMPPDLFNQPVRVKLVNDYSSLSLWKSPHFLMLCVSLSSSLYFILSLCFQNQGFKLTVLI